MSNTICKKQEVKGTDTIMKNKADVIKFSDYYVPEGYTTGRIFRKDRTIIQNLKRLWIVFCRDNIYPYLYTDEENSKYYLIKDRRRI